MACDNSVPHIAQYEAPAEFFSPQEVQNMTRPLIVMLSVSKHGVFIPARSVCRSLTVESTNEITISESSNVSGESRGALWIGAASATWNDPAIRGRVCGGIAINSRAVWFDHSIPRP